VSAATRDQHHREAVTHAGPGHLMARGSGHRLRSARQNLIARFPISVFFSIFLYWPTCYDARVQLRASLKMVKLGYIISLFLALQLHCICFLFKIGMIECGPCLRYPLWRPCSR